jgi:NADH-quinone oxidoreductase subunit N
MLFLASIGAPFIPHADQLRPFLAELWLIAAIVGVLLAPFFTRRANLVCGMVALIGVLLALLSLLIVGANPDVIGSHFRGLLVFDRVAFLWQVILLLFVAGIIVMGFATTIRTLHESDGPEFYTLLLGATLGMCLMAETSNLLMIFMAVELASLPSYVLAGFRKTHRLGAEASLKYVLFGAVTSSIVVYGLSFLYGLYGTLQLHDLAVAMTASTGGSALLVVAVFGLIVGIGFKIAAVPFHFWCPDVFEGASIDVTAFLSVASKGAGLILLLRVLETIAAASNFSATGVLTTLAAVVGVIGAISATVGNTAAFAQTNIKRLLAYSSIAHAGYILCAVSLVVKSQAADAAFVPADAAAQAVLLYLAVYAFMNLGAFMVTALVGETLKDFRGLGRRAPLLAACMFCCLVSLIGLPPFAGFAAKVQVLWALFQNGGWWWALIIVIAVNTIASAFYYFRIVRAMYLEPGEASEMADNPIGAAISLACAAALVLLFFAFGPLSRLTSDYGRLYLPAPSISSPTVTSAR